MELITALAIGGLFGIAIFQLLQRNLIRSVIGLILVGNAINLFLLSTGAYQGVVAAYAGVEGQRSDALPWCVSLTASTRAPAARAERTTAGAAGATRVSCCSTRSAGV